MKSRIEQILERELKKLDDLSMLSGQPLTPHDIKSLDTLIKAYRSFIDPASKPAGSKPADPASESTDSLLQGLNEQPES